MGNIQVRPSLGFSEAIKLAWSRKTEMKGRSRRSEFWWAYLGICLSSIVLSLIPFVGWLISVVLAIFSIPLTVRRLHDSGRSGYWLLGSVVLGFVVVGLFIGLLFIPENMSMMKAQGEEALVNIYLQVFTNVPILLGLLASFILEILILVFLCLDGNPEPNRYGDSPKYVIEDSAL